jgi:hypothetical protein
VAADNLVVGLLVVLVVHIRVTEAVMGALEVLQRHVLQPMRVAAAVQVVIQALGVKAVITM